jgi:hypothetical protein
MREKVHYLIGIAAAMMLGTTAAMMWPQPVQASAVVVQACANSGCLNNHACSHDFGHYCDLVAGICELGTC